MTLIQVGAAAISCHLIFFARSSTHSHWSSGPRLIQTGWRVMMIWGLCPTIFMLWYLYLSVVFHPTPRNTLSVRPSVRSFVCHVFYPQQDNGAQSERLL